MRRVPSMAAVRATQLGLRKERDELRKRQQSFIVILTRLKQGRVGMVTVMCIGRRARHAVWGCSDAAATRRRQRKGRGVKCESVMCIGHRVRHAVGAGRRSGE